MQPAKVR